MTSSSSSSPEIKATDSSQDRFSYKLATHEEVLDDLSSRFILNLPDEELSSLERICFQVEQAHWFYEDFIREENPKFPSLALKRFSEMLFQACPLLHQWSHDHEMAYTTFMQYKTRVPVCGAIMLNDTWEKCVLVKGWKSSSGWGFPKGKINQVEPPASCAIREVLEETGYNLAGQLNPENVIEMSIREQKISLFIVPGVPEDYPFKTKTRKEISKIEWFRLADLPTWKRNKTAAGRFYLISPFIGPLKAFINGNKPRHPRKTPKPKRAQPDMTSTTPAPMTAGDAVHESAFQSSSVDVGEQHTPSPSESYPNTVPNNDSATATMDPHFANLLSALAISASTIDKPAAATSSASTIEEPPEVRLSVSLTEDRPAAAVPYQKASTSTQVSLFDSAAPSAPTHQPLSQSPQMPLLNGSVESTVTQVAQSVVSQFPLLPSGISSQPSPRASSIPDGDISKQHIALLDAVSKEAARLQEAYKIAAANGVPINVNDNFKYPVLTTSTPLPALSPRMPSQPTDFKYAARHGLVPSFVAPHATPSYPYGPAQPLGLPGISGTHGMGLGALYAPLQERPRTSVAYHRGPLNSAFSGSASMNQSQLLALMNGSSVNPSVPYTGHSLPSGGPNPHMPPFYTPVPGPRLPLHTPQFSTPTPTSVAPRPMTASRLPAQNLPAANNPLLSILNGGRSTSRFSDPYSSTPIVRE
ncbi:hypothetical protein C0991_000191 [Blastosporella zonata]|nr:hypothetical protein C0991_000191 [Blastosporella zonata]